ncbi:MAG: hypothetical protein ACR2PL_17835 [Dehalococcoidia bacterium]
MDWRINRHKHRCTGATQVGRKNAGDHRPGSALFGLYFPTRYQFYRKGGLENWYFTPGGFGGGVPTANNKQLFVTG